MDTEVSGYGGRPHDFRGEDVSEVFWRRGILAGEAAHGGRWSGMNSKVLHFPVFIEASWICCYTGIAGDGFKATASFSCL